MQRVLITGSNRGIGLDLARRYLEREDTQVFATCRDASTADNLNLLVTQYGQRAQVIQLDVSDGASITAAVETVSNHAEGLDLLINNAGINPKTPREQNFGSLDADAMLQVLNVNAIGPVMVIQTFAELLRQGTGVRVVNISSGAGSMTRQSSGCNYAYNASKAALNMYTRCLAGTFRSEGVIVIALNPGWVRTDMGGSNATLDYEDSVPKIMTLVDGLTMEDSGHFFQYDGGEIPW